VKAFIHDDFMLSTDTAKRLYQMHAVNMPIFDYHCHLSPRDILEDKSFSDMTEIWLGSDHYKWRLMRANGVEERYITGDADPYDKFLKWAETLPKALGNPLYHWTHLELKRYFGVDELLSPRTAPEIWKACNEMLAREDFSARSLIKRSNVRVLCTTDDPVDDLSCHIELDKAGDFQVKVLPTFRPDAAFNLASKGFTAYISRLSEASGISISSFDELVEALRVRALFFKSAGCRISDISFGSFNFSEGSVSDADNAFRKALAGDSISQADIDAYRTWLMVALGSIYSSLEFVMQVHMGVIHNTNERMFDLVGPDTGFDAIGNGISANDLARLLNAMCKNGGLPKMILYCLNDQDNAKIASIIGCFQGGGIPGKLQLGAAWWFNDHKDGMLNQLRTLGNLGLLGNFVGMLTDSRSFLSYPRHEYFRRVLCDLIGEWAERGEVPQDGDLLGQMVEDICYNNAVRYFSMNDKEVSLNEA